jgi:hypothetical protein
MASRTNDNTAITAQGVELVDLVIARVRADPRCIAGFCGDHPLEAPYPLSPAALNTLTFPSGQPLPPSLARWLAFDGSWLQSLGWFASLEPLMFTPRTLGQIADAEFGPEWREIAAVTGWAADPPGAPNAYTPLDPRFPECFLLPEGTESRRIFAVTAPDELGEYPVLVIDDSDAGYPYAAIMYPGFDVYLGDLAGVLDLDVGSYESLHEEARYAARLALHARHLFGGKPSIEGTDPEWGDDEEVDGGSDADPSTEIDRT